ncbi:hypothetical protein V8F06_009408 [Rhypophila decipiens]
MDTSPTIPPPSGFKQPDPKAPFHGGSLPEMQEKAAKYIEMSKKFKGRLFSRTALRHMESVINLVRDFTGGPKVSLTGTTPLPAPVAKAPVVEATAAKPKIRMTGNPNAPLTTAGIASDGPFYAKASTMASPAASIPKPRRKGAAPPAANPEAIASRTRAAVRRGEANVVATENTTATATTSKGETATAKASVNEKTIATKKATVQPKAGLDAITLPTRSSSRLKASGKASTAESNFTAVNKPASQAPGNFPKMSVSKEASDPTKTGAPKTAVASEKPSPKKEATPSQPSQSSVPKTTEAAEKKRKRSDTEASDPEDNNKKAKRTNIAASEQQSAQQSSQQAPLKVTRSVTKQNNVAANKQQPSQQAALKVTRSVAKAGASVQNESLASTSDGTALAAVATHKRKRVNDNSTSALAGSSRMVKQDENDATNELPPKKKIRIVFKPRNCTPEELAHAKKIMNGELLQFAPMPKKAKITIINRQAPQGNGKFGNAIQEPVQSTDTANAHPQSNENANEETVQQAAPIISAHVTHVLTREAQGQVSRRLMLTIRGLNPTKKE